MAARKHQWRWGRSGRPIGIVSTGQIDERPRYRQEKFEMRRMLRAAGYAAPASWARRLAIEGMGPEELKQRLKISAPNVGSLYWSHGMKQTKNLRGRGGGQGARKKRHILLRKRKA